MDTTSNDVIVIPSDDVVTTDDVVTKPKRTRKPKSDVVTFSSVIQRYASTRNIDATRAGKAIRSKIRAMGDDAVCKAWPEFRKSQKMLHDGNRYPTTMPRTFADALLSGRSAK
jgi:hypothetical protein